MDASLHGGWNRAAVAFFRQAGAVDACAPFCIFHDDLRRLAEARVSIQAKLSGMRAATRMRRVGEDVHSDNLSQEY
ncbi:hypothetical protein [Pseudomonas sp. 3A(2025)]